MPTFAPQDASGVNLSRLIYISENGNDALASNVYGRNYYLPSDPEIGSNPTEPVGEVIAYRTFAAASQAIRLNARYVSTPIPQYPDWVLFKRGETHDIAGKQLTIDVNQGGPSSSKRKVITAYGSKTLDRPKIINTGAALGACLTAWGVRGGNNIALMSLDFTQGDGIGGPNFMYSCSNILIEDCAFRKGMGYAQNGCTNLVYRKNTVYGNYSAVSHNQGLFVSTVGSLLLEENVFDMNGYKEDPTNPNTWTAGQASGLTVGQLPVGTGVQPTRTWYDRDLYLSSYTSALVVKNIISRGGGGTSVQMRVGGIARENVFLFNHAALSMGTHPEANRTFLQDSVAERNLVLHDEFLLPPGGWGTGIVAGTGSSNTTLVHDNVIAHFHGRGTNGQGMLEISGLIYNSDIRPAMKLLSANVSNNIVIAELAKGINIQGSNTVNGVTTANVGLNAVVKTSQPVTAKNFIDPIKITGNTVNDVDYTIGPAGKVNHYYAPPWTTQSSWQAKGYDNTSNTNYTSIETLAQNAGWRTAQQLGDVAGINGWERDILTYMQEIDPSYVVDENVTTDAGVPIANRRPNAQVIWQILVNNGLSETLAKKAARRYHAFLTFIERARGNRRGSWDSDYTADSLNNYIREGFGKSAV